MMTNEEQYATSGTRIYFLDNLRTIIIFLVVLYHVGGVYESSGLWASFWLVDDPATNNLAGILNIIVDIFVMPALFFISGYLAPISLKNRTAREFIAARFRRLILPWLVAVVTLIPLYKVIFLYSRDMPQESWATYFHFSSGNITSQNWLWFLPVLFLFNLLYALLASAGWAPAKIPFKLAIAAAMVVGMANSFGLEMLGLRGWTLTALIDFQNERLLVYFLIFLLGSLGFQQRIFAAKPKGKALYTVVNSVAWIPVTVYLVGVLIPFLAPGTVVVSPVADRLIYWLSFYLSLLCLLYLLIETFRRYFDRPGRLWHELNQNSYYVYLIHVIALGGIGLLLLNTGMPSLLKYLALLATTLFASNLIVSLARRAAASTQAIGQPSPG